MTDLLDRADEIAHDECISTDEDVRIIKALVEIARAARENAEKNSITYRLGAALARLDNHAPPDPR